MYRLRSLPALLVLAGLLAGVLPGSMGAQETAPGIALPTEDVVARAYYSSRAELDALAGRYDLWEVRPDEGYAVLRLSPAGYRALLAQGLRLEVDPERTKQLRQPLSIPSFPCYRTVEETYATLQSLATAYPGLVSLHDIGDSWDKVTPAGPAGYDIWAIRISNQDIPGPKPRFFLMAEIHAREYATAELATRLAEYVLERYGHDPEITFFVDYHELYVVPMTNPDGRKFAEQGYMWRKNTDDVAGGGCTFPDYGIDLNRNYSYKWGCCGGSSGDPCAETYRGPDRASEPETQTIMSYTLSLFPDQNGPNGDDEVPPAAPDDATGIFITLHSYSELVLWPWGWTGDPAPNGDQLATIGIKLASYNGYDPHQSFGLYTTDGTTDDWSYGKLGIASFTFEIGTSFFQDCAYFVDDIWPGNREALLYAWRIAGTPYMTAYGPDARQALAQPAGVPPGSPATLTATIDDTGNGGQDVAAAEYYLLPLHDSTPPGAPGSGTALQPADGAWDSPVEAVQAPLDTAALAPGTYLLAVRGQDAAGHWGPLTATYFYILVPGVSPVIEGHVYAAGSTIPLAAGVEAGLFRTSTDPATGYYSMTVVSGTYDMTAYASGFATATVGGVVAVDHQVTQQDPYLSSFCDILADDGEAGNPGWIPQDPWALTGEAAHSPSHSWTDSPGTDYARAANVSLSSPVLDLSAVVGVALEFWHIYDTEPGYDYCYVEYSTDGGSTWKQAASYSGHQAAAWQRAEMPLAALDGQAQARIRFRLRADGSVQYDGWHIDDIALTGGGPGCPAPTAPLAAFSSNSPVPLGAPVVFSNESSGSPCPAYLWSFGDGITSTVANPIHTYAAAGAYTVTLSAVNALGSSSASHSVEVIAYRVYLPLVYRES